MMLSLLFSVSAMACQPQSLKPLVLAPTKNYSVEVDRAQEIILDGDKALPKIKGIKGTGSKGKPMLTVMSGLQVLEEGKMKSYPHRISIKMNEMEKEWDKPIEVSIENQGKVHTMNVQWKSDASGCVKAVVK